MEIEIDKAIIDATTECKKNFLCLYGDTKHLCKVEYCVSDTVHFIECLEPACRYKAMFGGSFFCTCPIRKEIYNRYKI